MRWDEIRHPRDRDGKFRGDGVDVKTNGNLAQGDFKQHSWDTTDTVADAAAADVAARWKVDEPALDAIAAEEQWPGWGDKTVDEKRQAAARHLVREWNASSGSPPALVAIDHVRAQLGLPDHLNDRGRRVRDWIAARPDMDRGLRSFGDAMYANTQHWLAARNIDHVHAYRAGFHDDKERPFTSWSTSLGGIKHDNGAVVREHNIPARLVMSVPATGFGTLLESEVVVLPGW